MCVMCLNEFAAGGEIMAKDTLEPRPLGESDLEREADRMEDALEEDLLLFDFLGRSGRV